MPAKTAQTATDGGQTDTAALCKAEAAALRLISRAEQCEAALELKLRRRGHDKHAAVAAIQTLAEKGLLDDSRYARLWLSSRLARKTESPRKLLAGIRAKGIKAETAKDALAELLAGDAEADLARRFAQSCLSADSLSSPAALRRALRAEGFSSAALEWIA